MAQVGGTDGASVYVATKDEVGVVRIGRRSPCALPFAAWTEWRPELATNGGIADGIA
jgi:hypothetical protein